MTPSLSIKMHDIFSCLFIEVRIMLILLTNNIVVDQLNVSED